jgi:YD repeat-containing protein
MKIKMISFFLVLVITILSCKKEDMNIVENADVLLISDVKTDNEASVVYLYNDLNLVIEEKSKFDFTMHRYNDNNQLINSECFGNYDILSCVLQVYQTAMNRTEWVTAENTNRTGTLSYEYDSDGQLVKVTSSRPQSVTSEYSEFSYDANNRIGRQKMFWDNEETGFIDYSYDTKGNLVKEVLYSMSPDGIEELTTTTKYDFDAQKNPYKSFSRLMMPGIYTNANNIIKETITVHLSATLGPDKAEITETAYEYNPSGYPVSKNGNISFTYN